MQPWIDTAGSAGTVLIVDDDALVRSAVDALLQSIGFETRCHASAQEVVELGVPDDVCCLVVDIRMPHLGGLEFQAKLAERGVHVPVIFMTGHGDIPMSVRAMKAGAVDFLAKPFRDQDMIDAVNAALVRDRARRTAEQESEASRTRYARLTGRERQVMSGVVRGLLNKQVAGELGISEITVKLHRSSLMRKLGVRSVPALVRIADAFQPQPSGQAVPNQRIGSF